MNIGFTLKLDQDVVRFSTDGKVVLLDAIKALTGCVLTEDLLDGVKKRLSGVPGRIEEREIPGEGSMTVINSEGWLRICDLLINHPCSKIDMEPGK